MYSTALYFLPVGIGLCTHQLLLSCFAMNVCMNMDTVIDNRAMSRRQLMLKLCICVNLTFYRAMHLVQSAVLRSHVVCLSVCPSVCDVGEL